MQEVIKLQLWQLFSAYLFILLLLGIVRMRRRKKLRLPHFA
ncbi:MAG: hypothetical protein DDT21_02679 [Syntrophomonadaceae bacterium]|nr:hypothetical protein [Bacillota bacterium]